MIHFLSISSIKTDIGKYIYKGSKLFKSNTNVSSQLRTYDSHFFPRSPSDLYKHVVFRVIYSNSYKINYPSRELIATDDSNVKRMYIT
jgi:hypothetical protein